MKTLLMISSLLLSLLLGFCTSIDTITSNQLIKDGDLIVSEGKNFALGFFSPINSNRRYVGIWYNRVSEQTVVWIANRDNPINGSSGVLSVDTAGNLVIHDEDSRIPVWSTNILAVAGKAAFSAKLLDTGNLVLFKGDTKSDFAWQSFDYPTNTMLPNMKLGVDRRTGLNRFLTSWKSRDDPGIGEYLFKIELNGSSQFFLSKGSTRLWRTGPWNGLKWSGVPEMTPNFIFNVSYVDDHNEVTVMYTIRNPSILSRLVVNESGVVERLTWHDRDRRWIGFWSAPKDKCDNYNQCGEYGNCDPQDPGEFECKCLPGFEPKLVHDWYLRDGSGGCKRKRAGDVCRNGEGFVMLTRAKLPDTSGARVDMSLGLKECEDMCMENCNCTGYTSADVRGGGSGCMTWYGKVVDTREFSNGGQDIYIRVDAAELAQYSKSKRFHGKMMAIVLVSVAVTSLFIFFLANWLVMKKRKDSSRRLELDEGGTNTDLPYFELSTLLAATDNFSVANELGVGGFGSVYKGRLYNGVEIAVKRLSKKSEQGIEEFKNEVTLIAKLQHRNLVRLLGYCIKQDEKMLIYEYLPNKGLDYFIFDKVRGSLLDWNTRYEIILGIARGMLYLHQDSRLRIIHRDLKASNVLLDAAMNPKISDFGMARMFGGDQIEANTSRIVGTYGYMSPEYAMQGLFSTKSDVFSFGVLILEIISGTKNNSYYQENSVNLIGHVWDLWKEGVALDIVDSSLERSYNASEIVRCIQIGLLCVQEIASDRPNMSEVAFMLSNETALSPPKQPAYIFRCNNDGKYSSSASVGVCSVNDVTVTMVEAR